MEADWSAEIGPDLPVIVVPWHGFVNLRKEVLDLRKISEAAGNPALADALHTLHLPGSPVFTSKCDLWPLGAADLDPYELDAGQESARTGIACYIDILLRDPKLFAAFDLHEAWVRTAALSLRRVKQPLCRADWVLRPAVVNHHEGYGITLYVTACSNSLSAAQSVFATALNHAITVTIETAPSTGE